MKLKKLISFRLQLETRKDAKCSMCKVPNRVVIFRIIFWIWKTDWVCRPCFLNVLEGKAKDENVKG